MMHRLTARQALTTTCQQGRVRASQTLTPTIDWATRCLTSAPCTYFMPGWRRLLNPCVHLHDQPAGKHFSRPCLLFQAPVHVLPSRGHCGRGCQGRGAWWQTGGSESWKQLNGESVAGRSLAPSAWFFAPCIKSLRKMRRR